MLTVEQALSVLADAAGPPRRRTRSVRLEDALGLRLAEDVATDQDVPPFRRAQMDGFAVGPGVESGSALPVVGRCVAGDPPGRTLEPGTAFRINTGAPVPEGTERVLPIEWTTPGGDTVRVDRLPLDAPYVVPAGVHAREGDVVVTAGTLLGPGPLGALAEAGWPEVLVHERPVVAVLSTGSELVGVGAEVAPGQVRNSNGVMLRAQARRAGAAPESLGIAPDDEAELERAIALGLEADLLVLSGGVSRGDLDLVPDVLQALGVETIFHRWKVQPGGPLYCGRRGDTLVFGLPGNPAASFVGFELLVVPAIRHGTGEALEARPTLRARLKGGWRGAAARRRFRPAELDTDDAGVLVAVPGPWAGSGDPFAAARASALVAIPEETEPPASGDAWVDVLVLETGS